MRASEVENVIVALLAALPDSELPEWHDDHGSIWFKDLSMGWTSASHPQDLARRRVVELFAAEAAGRELVRRSAPSGVAS
ncbi:MAG: hypothetical protein M3O32_11440 [Actinomycetota bacterium]|nr:hypothetical protein [Actinomycetota bacterium]